MQAGGCARSHLRRRAGFQIRRPGRSSSRTPAGTLAGAGGAQHHGVVSLPSTHLADPLWRTLAEVPGLPGAVLNGARDEAAGIWREARTLSGSGSADAPRVARASSGQVYFAWYGGLVAMSLLRVIEWRLALIIAGMHTVERYTHRRRLEEFLEGVGAGV